MTKILVIDDEEILRSEIAEWLTLEGYDAMTAEDGIAGIDVAYQQLPDLIICDITMPRLDGFGVFLELRANPATADISFIFVTARAAHEDIRKGMELGADDYLTKPFTRLELLQAIQTRLGKKAAQEQAHQQEIDQWAQAFEHERELRFLKAKLAAMFSHDFRNPLSSILSSNDLIRTYGDELGEQRRLKHHDRIEVSVRHLVQMLDDMLLVSQMEAGQLEFKPESLDVGAFVQRIVEEFQTIHREGHRIVYESRLSDLIMADPRLIRQIAANLISNALKYSPQANEVRILLDSHQGQWMLTVQDHGIGIPESDQQRLFSTFQRGSNVGSIAGTGLGLAIVKQAADLHGGSVHLESRVDKGTTVTVVIPVHPE